MLQSKIKSYLVFQNLFSYVSVKRKFKIIQYNTFLNRKLQHTIKNYKEYFYKNKIQKYNYTHIYNFWVQFQNDFKENEKEENLYEFFLNALSNKKDFNLKLTDKDFNLMIKNPIFKENIRIELEQLEKSIFFDITILLIQNNELTNKAMKVFKEIFKLYSSKGKMSKSQLLDFINETNEKLNDDEEKTINKLFSHHLDNDIFLTFEDFCKLYTDLYKNNSSIFWKILDKLGYNNLLDKKDTYDLDYLQTHLDEFQGLGQILINFLQIIDNKINKFCFYYSIDKLFIDYLNKKLILNNLKQIEISITNLKIFIDLNIVCSNVEELDLYIFKENKKDELEFYSYNESRKKDYDNIFEYNKKEITNIFPNILTLKMYYKINFDLIDLMRNLQNSKIKNLEINYEYDIFINPKIEQEIILENIEKLKINGNQILILFFDNIKLPNLKKYEINLEFNETIKYINDINQIKNLDDNDFNSINRFLIDILKNKKQFSLNKFINLPKTLKKITYLEINLKLFSFICKKNYFEFILSDENKFTNYYLNYDLSINEEEIVKYKKIKIEGLGKLKEKMKEKEENKIEEIIEKDNINLCDINFSLGLKKYYINNLKNIRTIYCDEEIQKTNLISIIQDIINKNNLTKLKYLNLTIGYINETLNENNLLNNNIFKLLSTLIKNSFKLKSLIIRLHPDNYNQYVSFFLSLIENLKKLKVVQIIENCDEPKYYLNESLLLNKVPKLKERRYCFNEFKITNEKNYIECIYDKNQSGVQSQLFFNMKQDYKNNLLVYKKEIKDYIEIFKNNKKIDFSLQCEIYEKTKIIIKSKKLLTNMKYLFYNCITLNSLDLSNFNTKNIINMEYMFCNCQSLTSLNFSNINTLNVLKMNNMFNECNSLISLDLSNFNTKNVTDMSYMFSNCTSLTSLNLSNFNTNNVTYMNSMFSNCTSLTSLDLSNFNTKKVNNMNSMFCNCTSLTSLNLSNFNTENVTDMFYMFSNCTSLTSLNLSNFNTKNVTDMFYMFQNCSSLISLNLSNFNTNNVTDMNSMFSKCTSLTSLDLSNFNTKNLIDKNNLFYGLNKKCKVITSNNTILDELKS